MTISTDTVYSAIIDNCTPILDDCIENNRDTFTITYAQFSRWLMKACDCSEGTARNKWKWLDAKGLIQVFGLKRQSAHVIVSAFANASGYYSIHKNKKIKIFQAELKGVRIDG